MAEQDKTKALLQDLLAKLYADQSKVPPVIKKAHLVGSDGQFLGNITGNEFDNSSILNQFGPYGSQFSPTSIFNAFSPYGSELGQFSVNNPFCTTPPKLVVNDLFQKYVTKNQFVMPRIATDTFMYLLRNDIKALLTGKHSEHAIRKEHGNSFIEAADGTFLGKLNPNKYDSDSIFNKYGQYGSKYAQLSIFNPYGTYGSRYASNSATNPRASNPPKVFLGGEFVGYLTKNKMKKPRIDPETILEWAEERVSKYAS